MALHTATCFLITLVLAVPYLTEGRSTSMSKESDVGSKQRRDHDNASCNAGGRTYRHGEAVIFHNQTYPILDASCTHCYCSNGQLENCFYSYCDIGLDHSTPLEVCEQWLTGQEGECCPVCDCIYGGNRKSHNEQWIHRASADNCHECHCSSNGMKCQRVWCLPCNGNPVYEPGTCCPRCETLPDTTRPPFTILLTTLRSEPTFPFPFPFKKKRELTLQGSQGEENIEQ